MTARKTAAQKAAEAAERDEYTSYVEPETAAPPTPPADPALSDVTDEKTGKRLTIQQLKNRLRNDAERQVLDAHKDEVITITASLYKKHNLEYVRRLTEQEKAQKDIEEKLEMYPELEAYIARRLAAHGQAVVASEIREAVPGGALAAFREGGYDDEADNYRDVEHREGD